MAFGYEFVTLDDEQKHARRVLLEYYPFVAQLSALVILALFQISYAFSWLAKGEVSQGRATSPNKQNATWAWWFKVQRRFELIRWWMRKPVIDNWGTRGEWILGGLWTVWLLFLSVVQTGNDYLHLTKRLGIIGASQLPLHYLLAMRSPYSPIQYLTRMSHEELKASHQVLGRIVFFLFALHAAFYLNFFVLSGFLAKRIKDNDVIWGIISIGILSVLTALGKVRRWNYRFFYNVHVVLAIIVIFALYFHVTHIRPYIYQTLGVTVIANLLRRLSIKKYVGTARVIPGATLIQVRIPLRAGDSALKWKPGQHVYLSRSMGQFGLEVSSNPFTVASIPGKDKELLLVARILNGNTKQLAEYVRFRNTADSDDNPKLTFIVEGPYGASIRAPDFSQFDKILLVAGGVGATFILPLYRSIIDSSNFQKTGRPQVRFIWTVRKLPEIRWAFEGAEDPGESDTDSSAPSNEIEVFVTRPSGPDLHTVGSGEEVEMAENEQLLSMEEQRDKPRKGVVLQTGRPKISAIVDDVFSKSGRVAIFVCGPKGLSLEVGRSVERWSRNGAEVYWHDESFDW